MVVNFSGSICTENGGSTSPFFPVKDTKHNTIRPIIDAKVEKGSKVYTDEWKSYTPLKEDFDHEFVSHSADEYVRGEVHSQGIENFGALLKGVFMAYTTIAATNIFIGMLMSLHFALIIEK